MVQTMIKTNVGCERYLPPERLDPITSRFPYDITSDVWAYGLTLLEISHLAYPYGEGNPFKRTMAIIKEDSPTLIREMFGVVYSDMFASLISTCLAKNPRKRPKYDSPPQEAPDEPSLLDNPFIKHHTLADSNDMVQTVQDWLTEIKPVCAIDRN